MATKNEKDTTRARANILREILNDPSKKNPMASQEIYEVMDLCLSCKGCKGECPSSVDMGKLKAEFLQQYYEVHGIPFRTKLIAHYTYYNRLASIFPPIYNFIFSNPFTSKIAKKITGFAPKRSIPLLYKTTLRKWFKKSSLTPGEGISLAPNRFPKERGVVPPSGGRGLLYLFCDEFTNYNDVEIGIKAVKLLHELGYTVVIPEHLESGRTYLSKGLVKEAQKIAVKNINLLKDKINENAVLVGIEPSAILTFRDEYLSLTDSELQAEAKYIAQYAFTFEEFIAREVDKGNIKPEQFTDTAKLVKVHGHCHQKALSSMTPTKKMLTLPKNYEVHMINSGCCGMAGSFGYEKEHYDISMQVGELVLFPTIRKQPADVIIVAAGTSCRHQIKDGTGRVALHPIEVLWEALRG
jgi:Fe-S oxidoreductase